ERLAGMVEPEATEGNQSDAGRLEHDLRAEEHDDEVAAREETDEPEGEEGRGNEKVVGERELMHRERVVGLGEQGGNAAHGSTSLRRTSAARLVTWRALASSSSCTCLRASTTAPSIA